MSPNSRDNNSIPQNGYPKTHDKRKETYRPLTEKQFVLRNSILTDLCEKEPTLVTIRSIFGATIISLFLSIILKDYIEFGEVTLGVFIIRGAFRKLHITSFIWVGYILVTFSLFYVFQVWAVVRLKLIPNRKIIKIWDSIWATALVFLYVAAFWTTSVLVEHHQLPQASAAIIVFETTRLIMKIHAYVRYNAERVVNFKPNSDQKLVWPSFGQYFYFLFAPVLLYRDHYPRTDKIRWGFVLTRAGEVIAIIIYQCFIFHRFIFSSYKNFGIEKFTWLEVIAPAITENSIPGLLILLAGFYVTLHSVQNLFGELLRFGDREFYKDWWKSKTFGEYFRLWNIVVQDWLYVHVYWDLYQLTRSKIFGKFMVFLVSVIVHEWAMTYILGFFYPVLAYSFISAAILGMLQLPNPKFRFSNLVFWYSMVFGSGLVCSLYTLEYYARQNQPDTNGSFWNYFAPRWYTCDCIV